MAHKRTAVSSLNLKRFLFEHSRGYVKSYALFAVAGSCRNKVRAFVLFNIDILVLEMDVPVSENGNAV